MPAASKVHTRYLCPFSNICLACTHNSLLLTLFSYCPILNFIFGSVVIVAVVALFSSNTWCCPTWDDIETCFSFLFTIHLRMDECRITVNTSMDGYLATLLLLLPVVNFIYEEKANIINYFILFHFCCSRISIVLLSQRSSQCIKLTVLVCLLLSVVVCI